MGIFEARILVWEKEQGRCFRQELKKILKLYRKQYMCRGTPDEMWPSSSTLGCEDCTNRQARLTRRMECTLCRARRESCRRTLASFSRSSRTTAASWGAQDHPLHPSASGETAKHGSPPKPREGRICTRDQTLNTSDHAALNNT